MTDEKLTMNHNLKEREACLTRDLKEPELRLGVSAQCMGVAIGVVAALGKVPERKETYDLSSVSPGGYPNTCK